LFDQGHFNPSNPFQPFFSIHSGFSISPFQRQPESMDHSNPFRRKPESRGWAETITPQNEQTLVV
jgi:hypothetical protein